MESKKTIKVGVAKLSRDLSGLKFMTNNRPTKIKHVEDLRKSMRKYGALISPVLINEKGEVIDGQHRVQAAKKEGLPLYLVECVGYGIEQVRALNMKQKNWTSHDYLHSFVDMGYKHYILLNKFYEENKEFRLTSCVAMCSNITSFSQFSVAEGNRRTEGKTQVFNEGTWEVRDLEVAYKFADNLKRLKPYYDGYNRQVFVGAMLSLMPKKQFNFEEFLHKLSLQPTTLVDCNDRDQCRALVEDIYNYKRREKVSLKY